MPRRASRPLHVGTVQIGGDAPIAIQSMTITDTRDVAATVEQIHRLEEAGCEVIRVAVPDREAALALPQIRRRIGIPLISDIHFDYRLALLAIEGGVDGLRLNPGNIRKRQQIEQVVVAARERGIPIRIGVNEGSLPPLSGDEEMPEGAGPEMRRQWLVRRMVRAALEEIQILEELEFFDIKISLKAFDVPTMVEAYRTIAPLIPYPLHLGVTEAGPPRPGTVRSAIGIGMLLAEGIGDTIRVSLTGDPVEEVRVCWEILRSLNLRQRGPTLVSCPSCGRAEIDLIGLATAVEERLAAIDKPIKIAVMGCVVNGPGEARDADLGIAGGKGRGVIFRHGKILKTCDEKDFLETLMAEAQKL
ncbi:MAG: flavodoxin-dependent (E)-4-hydroxy-3-methylbut-2-enyl-diphosphate synthase [Chloroflexi bacterium]|nr:flavodoxin-dependent (E)-4-hydroxy-3-methylbut-2-enyl-diphosphate synthase [Chloroflexota bacterium]